MKVFGITAIGNVTATWKGIQRCGHFAKSVCPWLFEPRLARGFFALFSLSGNRPEQIFPLVSTYEIGRQYMTFELINI